MSPCGFFLCATDPIDHLLLPEISPLRLRVKVRVEACVGPLETAMVRLSGEEEEAAAERMMTCCSWQRTLILCH